MDPATNPTCPVRRVLTDDQLHTIHTAVRDAADTRQLLGAALTALYTALHGDTDTAAGPITPRPVRHPHQPMAGDPHRGHRPGAGVGAPPPRSASNWPST